MACMDLQRSVLLQPQLHGTSACNRRRGAGLPRLVDGVHALKVQRGGVGVAACPPASPSIVLILQQVEGPTLYPEQAPAGLWAWARSSKKAGAYMGGQT